MIAERVSQLRKAMKDIGIDAYVIPSADFHKSEYVGEYFKARQYISGFTGSAGTVVVLAEEAGLWTDGRYFIQAEKQLAGSGISLFRSEEPGVPTYEEYLAKVLPTNAMLGFDGRVLSAVEGAELQKALAEKNISVHYESDLIGDIWHDRPALSEKKAFLLEEQFAGESFASKLARVRHAMREKGAVYHVLTTLDDICWLLNIRGDDVAYSPLVLSYAVISLDEVHLFLDESKLDDAIRASFAPENVRFHSYHDVTEFVKTLNAPVLLDPKKVNYSIYHNLPASAVKIEADNPEILMKARKNDTELENIRKSHIKDGVAFTRFMYWLKTNIGKETITEMSASDKLEAFRAEQEGFLWPSFAPICAYKANAAMMHYSASEESNATLAPEHLFLVDTGGNYYEGTTDITRTLALGELDSELKKHFTTVLRGMIGLARAKFMQGCHGYTLDVLARSPIWQLAIDYKCGTGHGVGYLLNIHEAPTGFRWYVTTQREETHPLEPGMLLTDEPGIYVEGSHGIRLENELIVKLAEKNEFGQFMEFEPVTMAPLDLDAVDPELLTYEERAYLNAYHAEVYEKVSPHLPEEEKEWLKKYTRAI